MSMPCGETKRNRELRDIMTCHSAASKIDYSALLKNRWLLMTDSRGTNEINPARSRWKTKASRATKCVKRTENDQQVKTWKYQNDDFHVSWADSSHALCFLMVTCGRVGWMQTTMVLTPVTLVPYQEALRGRERIWGEAEMLSHAVDGRKRDERQSELKWFSSKKKKKQKTCGDRSKDIHCSTTQQRQACSCAPLSPIKVQYLA